VHKDNTEEETPKTTKEHGLKFLETVKKTEDKRYVLVHAHPLLETHLPSLVYG
jgi:hypothetical protein